MSDLDPNLPRRSVHLKRPKKEKVGECWFSTMCYLCRTCVVYGSLVQSWPFYLFTFIIMLLGGLSFSCLPLPFSFISPWVSMYFPLLGLQNLLFLWHGCIQSRKNSHKFTMWNGHANSNKIARGHSREISYTKCQTTILKCVVYFQLLIHPRIIGHINLAVNLQSLVTFSL